MLEVPPLEPGSGACTALQIVPPPEAGTLAGVVSTQATSCVWVFLEAEVVHSYFWALGTQPGQCTAARELWVVTQAGLGFSSQIEDTSWCSLTLWGPWAPGGFRYRCMHAHRPMCVESNAAYSWNNPVHKGDRKASP